jgi:hypothetical protein
VRYLEILQEGQGDIYGGAGVELIESMASSNRGFYLFVLEHPEGAGACFALRYRQQWIRPPCIVHAGVKGATWSEFVGAVYRAMRQVLQFIESRTGVTWDRFVTAHFDLARSPTLVSRIESLERATLHVVGGSAGWFSIEVP